MKGIIITSCGAMSLLTGLSVLLGYWLESQVLLSWANQGATVMARPTAFGFISLGIAVIALGIDKLKISK